MKLTTILGTNLTVQNTKYTDLSYLKGIAEGSNEFMRKMIGSFIEQTPTLINKMEECLKEKRWGELRGIAHSMKPSVDFMGMRSIWNTVKDIEWYAGEKIHLDLLPDLVAKVKQVCFYAVEELSIEINYYK